MNYYNERAKSVEPGLTFIFKGYELRDSKFLSPIKQVVARTEKDELYYMPSSFCRYVANNGIELDTLIGVRMTIIEHKTSNGRFGLYVKGDR